MSLNYYSTCVMVCVLVQLSTISVRLLQTLEKFRNDQIKKAKVSHWKMMLLYLLSVCVCVCVG